MALIWQTRYQLVVASLMLVLIIALTPGEPLIRAVGFLLVIAAVLSLMFQGREYAGKVIHISDGDTLTLLTHQGRKVTIRLAGIDAPESKQAYGLKAAKILEDKLWQVRVRVVQVGKDRYGRIIGIVYRNHYCINYWLLENGHAWFYPEYSSFLSKINKARWQAAEARARQKNAGLWRENNPIRPRVWRKQHR